MEYNSTIVYKPVPVIYDALLTHMTTIWSNFMTEKLKIGILQPIVAKKQQKYGSVGPGNIVEECKKGSFSHRKKIWTFYFKISHFNCKLMICNDII